MDKKKVKKCNQTQPQEADVKRLGYPEICNYRSVSVITRNPQIPIKTSYEIDDEEVMIVAEYDKKSEITKLDEDPPNVSTETGRKTGSMKRKRTKSEKSGSGFVDNQFWYVECSPNAVDLECSDTESDEADDNEESEDAESNDDEKEKEILVGDNKRLHCRFEILEETAYYIPGQKIWKREMGVRIRRPNTDVNLNEWWEAAFRDLFIHLTTLTSVVDTTDHAAITFTVAGSAHAPVSLSCRPIRDFIYEDLFNLIGSAGNCAAAFKMDDTFLITTSVVRGSISRHLMSLDPAIVPNRSILSIQSTDMLSLPRSLVVARVYAERGEVRTGQLHQLWSRIRCQSSTIQVTKARELVEQVGVKFSTNGYGIRDVEKFQNHLTRDGIAIVVYEVSSLGHGGGALYNGTGLVCNAVGRVRYTLYLAYYERFRHYQPILNLALASGSRGFCAPCNARYTNEVDHECPNRCTQCFGSPPCHFNAEKLECAACQRCFFGSACFERHKVARRRGDSVCQTISLCTKCLEVVRIGEKTRHCCGNGHYLTRSQKANTIINTLNLSGC